MGLINVKDAVDETALMEGLRKALIDALKAAVQELDGLEVVISVKKKPVKA